MKTIKFMEYKFLKTSKMILWEMLNKKVLKKNKLNIEAKWNN